jgi:hypothetical protein
VNPPVSRFIVTALALALMACAAPGRQTPGASPASSQGSQPELSPEARDALSRASSDIEQARAADALWTTAAAAMDKALAAAKLGDNATLITQARIASELAKLGLAQKHYPSTEK